MINPGGSPGTAFSKSATTRFNNSQIKAQQASMPHNAAAQQALRKQYSGSTPGGPPVGPTANPNELVSSMVPQGGGEAEIPTGGPQMPLDEGFDPAVFKENMLDELVGNVRTQQFINSPRVKDAVTSVRLKNFLNSTNPDRVPDSRNLLSQVLSRMKMGPHNESE